MPLVFGAIAILLIVSYFAIIRPLVTDTGDTVTTTVTTGEGEGAYLNKGTLYPPLAREEIYSITVSNESGTFRFYRYTKEGVQPTATHGFIIAQKEGDRFVDYGHIPYQEERFSELVVATGSFYYHKNIGEDAAEGGVTLNLADYGLAPEQDPAWFEVTTLGGSTYRVYVGDPAVTDGGYYVRVEGRDTVYVSHSNLVGQTALCELPSFVDPTLTAIFVQTGYYFNRNFTLYKPSPEDYLLTGDDTVAFAYRAEINGVLGEREVASQDLRRAHAEMREAFIGKKKGDDPFVFTVNYPDSEEVSEELRGKTVTYHVEEITRIDRLYVVLDYLNSSLRSHFHSGVAYKITAPATMTGYLPNSNHYMGVLEAIGELLGSETVAVGLTEETMEKFGLGVYAIDYETPLDIAYDKVNTNDIVVKDYLPNTLFISAKQEGGFYYVGSILTDIVAKVDAATLSFLEAEDTFWLEDTMYSVNIGNATKLEFDFDYVNGDRTFTFLHEREKDSKDRFVTTGVSYLEGNRKLDLEQYRSLYMHLVTIYYSGAYDGEVPKEELLAAGRSVLTLTVTLGDGSEYTYRFYPYSARHVLVSVEGDTGAEGAYFYALSSEVEKLYRDILLVLDGKEPNPDKQY